MHQNIGIGSNSVFYTSRYRIKKWHYTITLDQNLVKFTSTISGHTKSASTLNPSFEDI